MDAFRKNRLLARIGEPARASLEPVAEAVELPVRCDLEVRGYPIKHVYFPTSGFASVVVKASLGCDVEAGLIGYEGMSAIALLMGERRSTHAVFMQTPGSAIRFPAQQFSAVVARDKEFGHFLLRYAYYFYVQASYTALSNGRFTLPQRLARWILMAQDRVRSDQLPLTHEFVSVMLGVRRSGVTQAMETLEKNGLIARHRGHVDVLNRGGLVEVAGQSYGIPEAYYEAWRSEQAPSNRLPASTDK